ncbi:MAG: aminopeptidase P N-terminal domain-containing protein [Acidobacteria bacterium]|nr:aminopeptidase P N-terminal domain-containing protein [Acidobacteriota bacterium]
MNRCHRLLISVLFSLPALGFAQTTPYYQPHFPPEEFRGRWQKVFDKIGDRAITIVQGGPQALGFSFPRQTNEFYYLCGIETPHSYLLLDGRSRKATLFLPPRNEALERAEGRILSAADAALAKQLTGVDEVLSTEAMTYDWMRNLLGRPAATIYALYTPAEGAEQSRGELFSSNAAIAADYWDGRVSREAHFINLLKTRFPRAEIRDLTPILDEMRSVKSPREIALIRRASQLAGLGILEAIKSTKPGVFEYQLDGAARYVFLINGARLEGYRSITASGTANIWNIHYYRNQDVLKAGDLVLMDYAPDYFYYTSDIARMWPVSGKYSSWQRELLQIVLEYRNSIIKRIRPGVTVKVIMAEAKTEMEEVFKRTKFSKPEYEKAARRLVETGVENFTDFLPTELDEIEKIVGQGGILQKFPGGITK